MNNKKYSAVYFLKTKKIVLSNSLKDKVVLMQFFQRKDDSILCGINESLTFLSENTDTKKYKISHLEEGSKINKNDIVLELEGNYQDFGIYEGVIDGILSRSTSIATNAFHVVKAANNKNVIFMADRSDHYKNQERDGYAASVGGVKTQVTDAHVEKHGLTKPVGTMPHVLIQLHNGDTIAAAKSYAEIFPEENLTVLIDFDNDILSTAKNLLKEFGKKLHAVRVDTSQSVSDKFFVNDEEFGVTPNLIKGLRKELDKNNGSHVKIIVSSGFDVNKIKTFEQEQVPVDIYGVGSSLLSINNTFTCDAVKIDGKKCAKIGRTYKNNSNLKDYKGCK